MSVTPTRIIGTMAGARVATLIVALLRASLLFAFAGLPEPVVALHGVITAAIGGGVASAVQFLYVARPPVRCIAVNAPPPRS